METSPSKKAYVTIQCPDYGPIKALRDISFVAYEAYQRRHEGEEEFFFVILEKSVEGDRGCLGKLTGRDLDAIASHYAQLFEAREIYEAARSQGKARSQAFALAFERRFAAINILLNRFADIGSGFISQIMQPWQQARRDFNLQGKIGKQLSQEVTITRKQEAPPEWVKPFAPLLQKWSEMSLPDTFLQLLDSFSADIAEVFWKLLGRPKGDDPKLPEALAELFVNVYLKAKYDKAGNVSSEALAGNGYVDIVLSFFDDKYIIELKVLDSKRSIGWAREGLTQLDQYMEANGCRESYLLVFDCRATDKGERLENLEHRKDDRIVHVIWRRIYWPKG